MKHTYSKKLFIHIATIAFMLFSSLQLQAQNANQLNLDFSKGWEGWTRYYSYFGPSDFWDTNSKNVYTTRMKGQCVSKLYQCADGTTRTEWRDCDKDNGGGVLRTSSADGSWPLCAEGSESWALKRDEVSNGTTGTFTIIDKYEVDPNMNEGGSCVPPFRTPPSFPWSYE